MTIIVADAVVVGGTIAAVQTGAAVAPVVAEGIAITAATNTAVGSAVFGGLFQGGFWLTVGVLCPVIAVTAGIVAVGAEEIVDDTLNELGVVQSSFLDDFSF